MNSIRSRATGLGIAAVASLLAGCASGASTPAPANRIVAASLLAREERGANAPSVLPPELQRAIQTPLHAGLARSRYVSDARSEVVYVSDYENSSISCFDPSGNVIGQLTSRDGLFYPQGISVSGGILYVANTGSSSVLEFKGCSGTLVRTLNDPEGAPVDVAASHDGHVYVSNIRSSSGPGNISVYTAGGVNPSGSLSAGSNESENFFLATDAKNDVLSTWMDSNGAGHVQCYPSPPVSPGVDQGIVLGFPGGIKVAANGTLAVGDQRTGIDIFAGGNCGSGGWSSTGSISSAPDDWVDIALNSAASLVNRTDISSHNANQLTFPGGTLNQQFITGFLEPIGVAVGSSSK